MHATGSTSYPAEDWHRDHQLLRVAFRQHCDARAKANFLTNDQSIKGDAEEPVTDASAPATASSLDADPKF